MAFRLWEIFKDPDSRAIISWLGGGAVVIAGGLWAVVTFVVEHKEAHDNKGGTDIIVSGQGIASGGNTTIGGNVNIGPSKEQIKQLQEPFTALENLINSLLEKNRETGRPGVEQSVRAAVISIAQGARDDARLQKALAFLKENEVADAARLLNAVAEDKSARAEENRNEAAVAYRNLGAIAGLRDPKVALDAYEKAVVLDPDNLDSLLGIGRIQIDQGDLNEAQLRFERVLTLTKTDDQTDYKNWALAGLGDIKEQREARLAALAAQEAKGAKKEANLAVTAAGLVPEDIQQLLYHRGHALLIGVSNYTSGWDQLPSVTKDLQDLQEGLAPYFQTVDILQSPTVAELKSKIKAFLLDQWKGHKERLFVYYSGHGFTDFNQASEQLDGYITGSDTPLYNKRDGNAVENAVPFTEITSWNMLTTARHVLMVFNSCFAGSLFQSKATVTEPSLYNLDGVRKMLGKPIRYFITACRQNEEVPADSTFATLLLRGLRGEADFFHDGIISADELGTYLNREVPRISQHSQTPQFNSIANARLSEWQFFFLTGVAAPSNHSKINSP